MQSLPQGYGDETGNGGGVLGTCSNQAKAFEDTAHTWEPPLRPGLGKQS